MVKKPQLLKRGLLVSFFREINKIGVRNVLVNVKQNQGYNNLIPSKRITKYQTDERRMYMTICIVF